MSLNQPLIIKNWPDGMAASPHAGLGLLKNVEIDTFSGAVRVGKKPLSLTPPTFSATFTANPANDTCTVTGGTSQSVPNTGTAVYVSNSGGALPTGLSANTVYFVIKIDSSNFKLATTLANANASTAIDITGAGSGTQSVNNVAMGTVRHFVQDPRTSQKFLIDSNGRVWFSNSGSVYKLVVNASLDTGTGTLTNAAGNGLAIFRTSDGSATYLFAYRNASIDVINVFGTSNIETPVWTNAWKSMNSGAGSGNSHYSIVGQDNIIYFTDDRYVGSIQEKAGSVFDPANAATYTYNNQALTLPLGSLTYWLEQLGVNLLISVSNDSYIYPWDRSSISYGLPIPIGEYGGNKMKNIGNVIYILAGTRGNVYWTQGTYIRLFTTIPLYATYNSTTPASNPVTWGGIASCLGKLLVGVSALSGQSGVYMIDSNAKLTLDNYPSSGQATVTALFAANEFYDMGYAGGADTMDTTRYSNFEAVIQSGLYRIGKKTEKTKQSQIEIQLANPVNGGAIRCKWRGNTNGTWNDIMDETNTTATTFSLDSTNTSYQVDCGIIDIENIQFQIEMSGALEVLEVRLNP